MEYVPQGGDGGGHGKIRARDAIVITVRESNYLAADGNRKAGVSVHACTS
jgi:hypothetical protein